MNKPAEKPTRRRKRWGLRILGVLLCVLVVVVARSWVRLTSTPDYWDNNRVFIEQTPQPELELIARNVENRLPSEWSKPIGEGDGLRTIRVNFDEINAWLAVRLPDYLANQNITPPREIGAVMLTQRQGQLVLAFDYESKDFGTRIASVFFKVQTKEDAPLAAGIRKIQAGKQRLPLGYVIDSIANQPRLQQPNAQQALRQLAQGKLIQVPRFAIDPYREATVLGLDVQPEGLDVTLLVQYLDKK